MKNFNTIVIFIFGGLLFCCTPSEESNKRDTDTVILESENDSLVPVFGNRFEISGDFNGDGKIETLAEHYFDGNKNNETNKFYTNIEYDSLVARTIKKNPICFVSSTDKLVDTLHIYSGGQLLGLSFLKNEGDLNNDGTDEVSYVIDWADWSNLNTWHLVTFKNNKWIELYSFSIWDWQIPEDLKSFKGLIEPIKEHEIQIIYMNDEALEDTTIINLNSLNKTRELKSN